MNILKSKTVVFGLLVTIFGALQFYLPAVEKLLDATTYGLITAGIGIIVIVLRFLTTVPLDEKDK